jgi:integrase
MRPVELKRYQPGDWQRSLHQLAVRAAKASNNRMVPLIPEAERWLLELERHDAIGPFDNGVIERAFHRALVKAGLAPKQRVKGPRTGPRPRTGLPRPYDLRHSLMTALTLETESTNAAQWMAGHKDPRMTQRYSLNAIPSVLRAAVDKLAAKMNREKLPEKVTKAVNS